jgi:hypothetical protein
MTEVCFNHWQVVNKSLVGIKVDDEQISSSLAVLEERLLRLKKIDKIFSNIEFSPYVKELRSPENALPVG